MNPELFGYLIPPTLAIAACFIFGCLVRQETRKTTALVAQLKGEFSKNLEEQAREIHDLSAGLSQATMPAKVNERTADLVSGVF